MKVPKIIIKRLKMAYGVAVPIRFQGEPNKALEYVAGFLYPKPSEQILGDNLPQRIKQIQNKLGNPGNWDQMTASERTPYTQGYIGGGHAITGFRLPRGGYNKTVIEHEADGVELMERAERNPDFIPHYAWEKDSSGASFSDFGEFPRIARYNEKKRRNSA